jgi:hypothetical protein
MLRHEVKDKTCMPVPQVLAWSSKPESGSVGTEYIILEHVSGVPLKAMWSRTTQVQHFDLIASIGKLMKQLCTLEFGAFGSLYLNTADKPPGTHAIDEKYCIGPHCGRHFWDCNDGMTTHAIVPMGFQGPCKFRPTVIPCSHQLTF